ncbi:MAG TPA: N-6 DNA methylase [Stellaceae bacterium]|jgi:type I restriction-modification system DNA methylase subunit|nr:N-6 DNA methylase [Stellaceae bacterium]
MPLFNAKTLEAALQAFDFTPSSAQQDAASHWAMLMRDEFLLSRKETSLEADFNRYVVQDVLGYRSFDASGAATVSVKQAVGAGEVDLALGRFSADHSDILAPFELKGPSLKNLDAIMPGRAKTPVQQAWEYANDAIGARWVIVSNQRELRLYAVGRGRRDYEEFDLSALDQPAILKRFVRLLGAQFLLNGETQSLLERSLREDKDITDKLYQEYREIRENLFQFIRSQHAEIPAEHAIRLAQKILDRIIFIAFAEDTVLLPDDSIRNAVNFTDPYSEPKPKWEYLRRLFDAVDHGNPRLNIPPYNGGLFAADLQLDSLAIPDHLTDQFSSITQYDFRSQVSVTILGHIFEQSITDIEQKHAEIHGQPLPSITKRKRDGVVYTPDLVTRFIVEHTIGAHLRERFQVLLAEHANAEDATGAIMWRGKDGELLFWRAYLGCVAGLRILDPACGSGAFLIAAFDFLKAEQTRVRERLSELEPGLLVHWAGDTDVEIITRNLYGVDVNSESVEITRLSLWLKTAKRGRQLESLDETIRWGNSLIEDADFHRRAFDWKSAFPEIFASDGFDIVIGNPPYVRMELIKPFKPYLEKRYEVVADRADLYAYFFELGVRLLKPGGRLGYISSSTFFRTGSGTALRRHLIDKAEIEAVVDFGDLQIFPGVTTYPAIVTLRRSNGHTGNGDLRFLKLSALPDDLTKAFVASSRPMPRARLGAGSWRFEGDRLDAIRKKMAAGRKTLAEVYGPPLYGIKTGLNEAFVLSREQRDALVARDVRSADLLKPFLVGENLKRWHVESDDLWLIYTPKNRIDIEEYPAIRDHLAPFRKLLEKRATKQNWWELQQAQAAYEPKFNQNKIIYPHFNDKANFSYDNKKFYSNDKSYIIPITDTGFGAYLNAKLLWFYFAGLAPAVRGGFREARVNYMGQLPVGSGPEAFSDIEVNICSASVARFKTINEVIHRLADIGTPARSFRDWYGLDFAGLRLRLATRFKIEIPVGERDEWERYFNARKAEVKRLSDLIADAEAEINDRVYRLFDLDRDEVALIEEAIAGQY